MKRMKKQQNNFSIKNKIEISRRTLLYSSAASLIPASLNAESIRDGSPSWMTTPGKTFSEYGFPAQQEINTKREILQPYEEYAPGTGVSMTPLEKLEGILGVDQFLCVVTDLGPFGGFTRQMAG